MGDMTSPETSTPRVATGARRSTLLAWTFAAIAVAAAAGYIFSGLQMDDLHVYQNGGRGWVDDVRLYSSDFRAPLGLPFTYPPFAAMTFALLAPLPWKAAVGLVVALGIAALAASCVLVAARCLDAPRAPTGRLSRAFGMARPTPDATALGLGVTVLGLLTEPVRTTLGFGQINLILLGLVIADCLLPKTPWPRGMLIGIAAAVKLTPAVFGLFFVASRQWRPAVVIVGTFIGAHALAWAVAPRESRDYWFGALPDSGRIGNQAYSGNQSLRAVVERADLGSATTMLWLAGVLVVLGLAALATARARAAGDDVSALLAVALAGLLCSPVSWSHHWVWVVPAIVALLATAIRTMRRWAWLSTIAVTAVFVLAPHWLIWPHDPDPRDPWTAAETVAAAGYILTGLLGLVLLALLPRRRTALT